MDTIAVLFDDADCALAVVRPQLPATPVCWVFVAVPPPRTRHIGRWVSHSALRQKTERWSADLFERMRAALVTVPGSQIKTSVARGPIADIREQLQARWPGLRLIDARRPRPAQAGEDEAASRSDGTRDRFAWLLASIAGLAELQKLAD